MPVEFALRPRIRLREGFAPVSRSRWRLPRFVLPVAAYWLIAAGIVYSFVHEHSNAAPGSAEVTSVPLAAAPKRTPVPEPTSVAEPAFPAAHEPKPEPPAATREPEPEPEPVRSTPLPAITPAREPTEPREPEPREPEPREPRARSASPAPPPAPGVARHGGLPSCETAAANANQDVDFSSGNRGADLPTTAIASVLENGAWLSSCSPPEHTSLDVCVAIKAGTVIGVSVSSRPSAPSLDSCIARRAAALQFPYSPRLDIARTRF